jgi:hypothetical protein
VWKYVVFPGNSRFLQQVVPNDSSEREEKNHPRGVRIGAKKKPTAAKTLWARELLPDIESIALDCGHNAIIRFGRSAGVKLFVTEAGNINHVNDYC